ncbi:MAG: M48 family metallopeptidase [Candidatus Levybacteria bacterium]|nr:M48 family metallopeptidase [Candidatus Levybacteria bacterium]
MNSGLRYRGENFHLALAIILALILSYALFEISTWLLIALIIIQLVYILLIQKQIQGNSLRINQYQFSDIHDIIIVLSKKMHIEPPDSYISFDPHINAFVMGFKKPFTLVLTSALVESMDKDEVTYIIGHELGHIRMHHAAFKSLVTPLDRGIPLLSFLFNAWLRRSEYTSDRIGFLSSLKRDKCISSLVKLAVGKELSKDIDIDDLVDQINVSYDEQMEKFGELLLDHPYITNRIFHLVQFHHVTKDKI